MVAALMLTVPAASPAFAAPEVRAATFVLPPGCPADWPTLEKSWIVPSNPLQRVLYCGGKADGTSVLVNDTPYVWGWPYELSGTRYWTTTAAKTFYKVISNTTVLAPGDFLVTNGYYSNLQLGYNLPLTYAYRTEGGILRTATTVVQRSVTDWSKKSPTKQAVVTCGKAALSIATGNYGTPATPPPADEQNQEVNAVVAAVWTVAPCLTAWNAARAAVAKQKAEAVAGAAAEKSLPAEDTALRDAAAKADNPSVKEVTEEEIELFLEHLER
jgi:hypothetical protein